MHAQHIDFLDLLDGQVQYIVPRWQRRYRWGQADIERLDKAHAKYSDMVLVHGGGPGTDRIAAQRAERNGVHQIVCKPDWGPSRKGRIVPAQRRAAEPPVHGPYPLPWFRHHRQPGREVDEARHPRRTRGLDCAATTGRADPPVRPVVLPFTVRRVGCAPIGAISY